MANKPKAAEEADDSCNALIELLLNARQEMEEVEADSDHELAASGLPKSQYPDFCSWIPTLR